MTTSPIPITERLHARLTAHLRQKGLRLIRTVVPEGWEPYEMMEELRWEDGPGRLSVVHQKPAVTGSGQAS